jgi:hypothetical protein
MRPMGAALTDGRGVKTLPTDLKFSHFLDANEVGERNSRLRG